MAAGGLPSGPTAGTRPTTSQPVRVARYGGTYAEVSALQELAQECARAVGFSDQSGAAVLLARDGMQGDRICLMAWEGVAAVGYGVLAPGSFGPLELCWWLDVVYVRPSLAARGAVLKALLKGARQAAGARALYYVRRGRHRHRAAHGVMPVGMVFRVEPEDGEGERC